MFPFVWKACNVLLTIEGRRDLKLQDTPAIASLLGSELLAMKLISCRPQLMLASATLKLFSTISKINAKMYV